jgi:uncharacterized protein (TIGR01777 family)
LREKGHTVTQLVRKETPLLEDEKKWDPEKGQLDPKIGEICDCIINLSGENIASKRWSEEKKRSIKESRIKSTKLIVDTLIKGNDKPKLLINASACGIYGNRGDEVLTETSSKGQGFLAEVCSEWEEQAMAAQRLGMRVICLRSGMVVSTTGGALKQFLPIFRLGLGGKIGSGEQYMSWIAIDDLTAIVGKIIEDSSITGPINVVAPFPIKNKDFTKILGHVLRKPAVIPLPAFAAKLAFGDMADELLLSSQRVIPEKLEKLGYTFLHPSVDQALEYLIERNI